LEVWDEDDKDQASADTDALGFATLSVASLWASSLPRDHALKLTGRGAGSHSTINVRVAAAE
jgi:hypothetical protein